MSLVVTRMPPWQRPGRLLLRVVIGFGLATIGFGLSRNFALSLFFLSLVGATDTVSVIIRLTLEQTITPDALRGRVSSINFLFIGFSNELGSFESGAAAALLGPIWAVVGGGIASIAIVGIVAVVWPQLARIGPLHTLSPEKTEGQPDRITHCRLPIADCKWSEKLEKDVEVPGRPRTSEIGNRQSAIGNSLLPSPRMYRHAALLLLTSSPLRAQSPLVLQTDFGLADGSVAAMKGVALTIEPRLVIHDLTHQIPPYDIREAALRLRQTIPWWPQGTVFVSVVDPGVGTERRAVVVRTRSGHYVVTPDNGTLTWVADCPRHRGDPDHRSRAAPAPRLGPVAHLSRPGSVRGGRRAPRRGADHAQRGRSARPIRSSCGSTSQPRRARLTGCAPPSSGSTSRSGTSGPTRRSALLDSARVTSGDSVRVTMRRGARTLFQGTVPVRRHVRRGRAGPAAGLSQQPARPGPGAQPGRLRRALRHRAG